MGRRGNVSLQAVDEELEPEVEMDGEADAALQRVMFLPHGIRSQIMQRKVKGRNHEDRLEETVSPE